MKHSSEPAARRQTHRVVACTGGDATTIERRPVPRPGRGELLLGLRAVGLCGTDLFKLDTGAATPGSVLGHELVGEVLARGEAVEDFALGDRVAVPHHVPCGTCALCLRGSETMCPTFRENLLEPGGFAERVLVRARARTGAARHVPHAVSDEAAVFMEPGACVVRSVERSGLETAPANATVLGAGSMGLLHLLVLKAMHPRMAVVMVDPDEARRALATGLGADRVAAPDGPADSAVDEVTGGLGADAVFDTVGGARALEQGLALAREGGSVVLFAHAPSEERASFDLNDLFKYERRVIGSYSGGPREQARVFDLICSGRLDPSPLITHRLPLERFEEGVALARERRALKVLFIAGDPS